MYCYSNTWNSLLAPLCAGCDNTFDVTFIYYKTGIPNRSPKFMLFLPIFYPKTMFKLRTDQTRLIAGLILTKENNFLLLNGSLSLDMYKLGCKTSSQIVPLPQKSKFKKNSKFHFVKYWKANSTMQIVMRNRFQLNGHTVWIHWQTQKWKLWYILVVKYS